ncbi:MAG: hypothetical protein KIT19_00750 [Phycisphaeraceae bacterium]|nr:hypothetical protein [Phycisphaeraceae bacterium]
MAADRLILVIGSGRVDGARVRGRHVIATSRVEASVIETDQFWESDLAGVDDAIAQVTRSVGAKPGSRTTVVYDSPYTTVEAIAVPGRGSEVAGSMRLALSELVGSSLDMYSLGHEPLWRARDNSDQSIGLWAAESEASVSSVCAMLDRAGLVTERIVPRRAVSLAACWSSALALDDKDAILVDVDEHITTLCGMIGGVPRLVRQVSLGTDQLADAYMRAIRHKIGDDGYGVRREDAAACVWSHGVPSRNEEIGRWPEVKGQDVLPLMQSVVQRLAIEIKQTARFGLDTESRPLRVYLSGPGARVKSLDALLSDYADSLVRAIDRDGAAGGVWGPEETVWRVISNLPEGVNLLPARVALQGATRFIRRATLVGAGIAAALVVADVGSKGRGLARVEAELAAISPQIASSAELVAHRERAIQLSRIVTETEQRLRAALGDTPEWHAALASISEVASMGIHVSDISCGYEHGKPVMTLRGSASITEQHGDSLRALMAWLSGVPVFDGVTLGSTRLQQMQGAPSRTFSISMKLRQSEAYAIETGGGM